MEYSMNLHTNTTLFDQAIRATAQQLRLQEIYIEKDYWVTYALYTIFHDEIGKQAVFKGGTALSKCYGFIERFSEDIDLVAVRTSEETDNQLKTKIKAITNVVSGIMPEVTVEGITQKRGMNRKTGHSYPKIFKGNYGQVRDVVIVEASWLGYFEPYTIHLINSFIYEMMLKTGQQEMAKTYGLLPFDVQVLDPRRTICEKIMSLVRFSYTENPVDDLRNKVRHTYDLYQLLQQKDLFAFFNSDNFDDMLLKVAQDDVASFRNNNAWLVNHPIKSLFFLDLDNTWNQIKGVYSGTFKGLVYGELPKEDAVLCVLKTIKERLQKVNWNIQLNN
ncbi:MAG: nucleotidyl transferase AbiEii/AbiGii toxin family protein [Prolixibacteraceae bacterium]|nr:nucleotidyl transferase AbiEii/AbiGii toxin family protein [Prolixibacteraceae bacterium]